MGVGVDSGESDEEVFGRDGDDVDDDPGVDEERSEIDEAVELVEDDGSRT